MKKSLVFFILCFLITLVGCGYTAKQTYSPIGECTQPAPVVEKASAPVPAPVPPVVKLIPKFDPIYFDFDKSNIKPSEASKLDKVADYALKNPNEKFLIEGNCDKKGSEKYNMVLGQKRADAAKDYLVKKGVDASRITTKSNGNLKAMAIWTATDRRDDIFMK